MGCEPDLYLSEWNMEVDVVDIGRVIQNLPDVFPVRFDNTATRSAGSSLVPHSLERVRPVVNIYNRIWADILPCIT